MTAFPNSYGHEKQEEAGLEVHQFYPLVEVGCYKHLKFFLCAMYTPICQENYEMEVMPCREVCIEARKRCAPIMQQYGFKWPVTLSCDTLPKSSDQSKTGEICAAPPDATSETSSSSSSFEQHPKETVYKKQKNSKHYPSEIMDVKSAVDEENFDGMPIIGIDIIDTQCECRCVKPFHVTEFGHYKVHNVSNCAYSCRSSALSRKADQIFMDNWITAWASGCLFLCAFTALTFLIEMERFPYPERPIFFLSLCQGMVSIGFLLRVYLGHEAIACDGNILKSGTITSNSCLLNFILIYYFGMSAATWWVILSLTWVLAAVPNWSTEWIAKYSTYFHLFSWCLPFIQTVAVIMFEGIDGDSLSGICYVGNTSVKNLRYFVLLPLIIYFIVGVCFLIIGFLNLWGIGSSLKKADTTIDRTSKLTQLMSKIGIFSVLYTIPAIFVILSIFYEQHYRPIWEQSQLCPCMAQIKENIDTTTILSLIKTASMLIVGWTSGVWVFSIKTIQSWKNFLCCCCIKSTRHQQLRNHHNYALSHDGLPYMAASTEHNTLSRNVIASQGGYINHHSTGTSPLSKFHQQQQNDMIFANRECLSPLIYGGGTLKHCSAMRGGGGCMGPEDV
uniref:Uncharacterized protein n=1 Tax=Panagrolaimus davidi TaxID=227884 RepID=A0A914PYK3_9BILA